MEVIRKAREQDHVIVPKRREGESPIGRVGQVCAEKAVEDKFGVIVGWDESFSKQTCSKYCRVFVYLVCRSPASRRQRKSVSPRLRSLPRRSSLASISLSTTSCVYLQLLSLLLARANPPCVSQLWEPYINSPTFTYAAEETLDLDLVWGKSFDRVEVSNISDVHEVGRYFGSWWETTGSAEPCFMLSPEWRARYPDD